MLKAGDILDGRYEVMSILGQGGMGTVYLCRNNRLGKLWAIKEIPKEKDSSYDFPTEAELLRDLEHPGIPRVFDIFYEENNMYMVEDYIKGETIESLINREGPMKDNKVYETALKLCDILEYLHGCNPPVIYRDLKPSNIMITQEGKIYLIDFGISRTYKEFKNGDTVYMGSKGYAAPEQYGNSQSGKQTDVFGLGSVMYFMAKGTDPAFPIGPSWDDTYDKWADKRMKNIIRKATQLESANRYPSIMELKEAIVLAYCKEPKEVQKDKTRVIHNNDGTMVMTGSTPGFKGAKSRRRVFRPVSFISETFRNKRAVLKLAVLTLAFFAIIFSIEHFVLADINKKHTAKDTAIAAEPPSKPAVQSTPLTNNVAQPSLPDTSTEGYIDMSQPIILDSGYTAGPGKGKGKSKNQYGGSDSMGTFYEVKPLASVSEFNNHLIVSIEYVQAEDNKTAVYCSINNTLGESIGISLANTCLYPEGLNGIPADISESTVPDSIESDTGKQYVKFVFDNFYLASGRFAVNTSTVSQDPSYNNRNISLTVDVK